MPGIASVSQKELAQRRKKLRRQRQMKIIQAIWQTIAISGLAGGLLWVALQPIWVLKTPEQVLMKSDNQLLSQEAIKSLLVLSYPQSLWRIQPAAIADSLKKQPTIAQATVSRRLFPPGLIIEIEERIPVAVAQRSREQSNSTSNKQTNTGLIDANGVWIPLEKYTLVNPQFKLPTLKVIGLPEQYAPYWSKLYPYVSQSSIKITEIDYQDPNNLILKTELGRVYLGATSTQLADQINLLAQLRHINTKLNPSEIDYIDLKNPESPLVHMIQNKETTKNQTP
ncbi:cell division protein FtsQ [Trichormus variabilis ATCC 29413]|uniref:Cell division protein FtsQ n=2 Tax=Anabaena variabilis TaxID=264691 RepID=Q3MC25_TRIV2|nr:MULTISPECIES: cell division protein FtsQ/DivIB [Nostocaceae]ABA21461.1 cell division protein FtsQ [Trichormus variabilis ATCC 29413]MBC1213328.1 cell division protein FtsQ/DivIB [Trichormus variabilis ARAD]MBC1255043.1 cell division protein FtsQ/DivIB [Trichormus variabilis V5]MBC1269605.1 cell division protein FtsQ/DivIB [Trichormus variabilis FSR]MBC1301129.1 cell division protein FtsQ/DivIB [Trichormus variabilis N2B]